MQQAYDLYLTDILRIISDALLVPVIIILLLLIVFALWSVGSLIAEFFTERRNFKANMPELLAALAAAEPAGIPAVVDESGLLNRQKRALLILWDYRMLPEETFVALAKRLIATEDLRYKRIADRQNAVSKIAPMFGLMGTLIPLGPGIVALGQNDLTTLSSSIGTAFYTTVAGLVSAAVSFVISKIRTNWYEEYMTSLEAAVTTIIELVEQLRNANEIDITEPGHSVFDLGYEKQGTAHTIAEEVANQSLAYVKQAAKDPASAQSDNSTMPSPKDAAMNQSFLQAGDVAQKKVV